MRESLSNKWWHAADRELCASVQVSTRILLSRHFIQLGRETTDPWVLWPHGQKQTGKVMWLVVSFTQGKLESSCRNKGMQSKWMLAREGAALNAWNWGRQLWVAQTNASLDTTPKNIYRAIGCVRSSLLICICANSPPVGTVFSGLFQ